MREKLEIPSYVLEFGFTSYHALLDYKVPIVTKIAFVATQSKFELMSPHSYSEYFSSEDNRVPVSGNDVVDKLNDSHVSGSLAPMILGADGVIPVALSSRSVTQIK